MKGLLIGLLFAASLPTFAEVTQIINQDYEGQRLFISQSVEDIEFLDFEDLLTVGSTGEIVGSAGAFVEYGKSYEFVPTGYRAIELRLKVRDKVTEKVVTREEALWGLISERSHEETVVYNDYERDTYLIKDHYDLDLLDNDNFKIKSIEFNSKEMKVFSDEYGNTKRVPVISKIVLEDDHNKELTIE